MMLATLHNALPLYGLAALLLAGAILLTFGSWWILRGGRRGAGRVVGALVLAFASVPAWGYGLFVALIGWAATGCAPDAYECPF
jgi:hypothetical protein